MFCRLHQEAREQQRGVLSQWRTLPSHWLQRTVGLHAGRDHDHPPGGEAGPGGEEQEQIIPNIITVVNLVSLALFPDPGDQ